MKRLLVICALSLMGCQSTPSSEVVDEVATPDVFAAIESWATAFNNCDLDKASALYDKDAVFWGTLSPKIITTPNGIRQYFQRICSARMPSKVALGEQNVRLYGHIAINTGTYTFTSFADGKPRTNPARYSFTYRKKDGQWLIVDHHSSAVPSTPR